MTFSKITGLGFYVPENVVTNNDLSQRMDTSDEWITERTGIKERRFHVIGKDTVSNMAAKAAKIALERAGKSPSDIDAIVFATLSPDYYFPGSGVLLQRELGLSRIPCIDIRAQCSGFIYGLSIADQYIKTGEFKTVLIAGSEIQSNILEISDRGRTMSVIFGDGAGACVLEAHNEKGKGILSTHLHSDGAFAEELLCRLPSSSLPQMGLVEGARERGDLLPYMNGKLVFQYAVKYFPEVIREALAHNNLTEEDLDLVIPHQANARITEYVRKEMNLPPEKIVSNIHKYGNTTAASIPIAMTEAWEEGRIKEGDLIALAAFGSGFVWASALIRW
ncbi:MAG: beta-ketoacyl-ACP synthase III [Chitinophagales bacterium]|nr:ketoacyl-ACP synthase III [Chitinophagales bacterium]MDW8273881.1 beta-ketoacyl-ACP synthase III [Chitinophagales bacterium]